MIKRIFLPLFFIAFFLSGYSQVEFSGEVTLKGLGSTGEELPFWMYQNTRGRISDDTNFAGLVNAAATYQLTANSFLEAGAGVLYKDGGPEKILPDESYLKFENSWLEVIAGRKQKEDLYNGLSATNENILWSLNARPLPGLQLRTTRPILIFPEAGIGFEASLAEYVLEKDRYVSRARVHHKSLHFTYQANQEWFVKAGIQHFAQWGGISPDNGPQPTGIEDYIRLFTGREGGKNSRKGDQQNVIGNHLGSYELSIKKNFSDFQLEFIYNSIFEDGTGSRLVNFPDGRYGLIYSTEEKKIINAFLYEFYYTKNQSINSTAPHKNDNYFNHRLTYHSGWTYDQKMLGVPFAKYDSEKRRFISNRFLMHHFGISGSIKKIPATLPFKFLTTFGSNKGIHGDYSYKQEDILYMDLELLLLQKFLNLSINFSSEFNTINSPVYGVGFQVSKNF